MQRQLLTHYNTDAVTPAHKGYVMMNGPGLGFDSLYAPAVVRTHGREARDAEFALLHGYLLVAELGSMSTRMIARVARIHVHTTYKFTGACDAKKRTAISASSFAFVAIFPAAAAPAAALSFIWANIFIYPG